MTFNRPFFFITLVFMAGIACAALSGISYLIALPACAALAAAGIISGLRQKASNTSLLLVFFTAGFALASFYYTYEVPNSIKVFMAHNPGAGIKGYEALVADSPERGDGKMYFNARIKKVFYASGEASNLSGLIRVTVEEKIPADIRYGDTLKVRGPLNTPNPPKNIGEFDYGAYLKHKKIEYVSYVKSTAVEVINDSGGNAALKASYALKDKLVGIIYAVIPAEQARIMDGVLLGNQRALPREIFEGFRITGTAHILAVSGMNVALIALFVFMLLKLFGVKRKISALIVMLCVFVFAVITGAQASVVRASIMAFVVLTAYIIERKPDMYNALAIAAFLILFFKPGDLFDAGFQLSFLATFGIVYFNETVKENFKQLPSWLVAIIATTVTAQILLTPVIINTFHQFSLISVLANMFIVPLSGLITITGFAMWLAGLFSLNAAAVFGATAWALINVMVWISETLSRVPFASVSVKTMPVLLTLVYYMFFLLLPFKDIEIRAKYFSLRHTLGSLLVLLCLVHVFTPGEKNIMYAFALKNSGAVYLTDYQNKKILILGKSTQRAFTDIKNSVAAFMRHEGVNTLDVLILKDWRDKEGLELLKRGFWIKRVIADSGSFLPRNAVFAGERYNEKMNKTQLDIYKEGVSVKSEKYQILFSTFGSMESAAEPSAYYYTCGFNCGGVEKCFVNSVVEGFNKRGKYQTGTGIDLAQTGMAQVSLETGEIKTFKTAYIYEDGY